MKTKVEAAEAAQEVAHTPAHPAGARNMAGARSTVAAVDNSGSISGPTAPLDAILAGKDMARRHST